MKLARSDAANTAAALTSATPIIRAAALDEVRRGARATLSRASTPGVLNNLATGQPIARVTGRAIVDDNDATPRNRITAPPPANRMSPGVPPGRTNSPIRNITMPSAVSAMPMTSRFVWMALKPNSGRIAAIGGIRPARRAGTTTDAIVMPMPTTARHHDRAWREHRLRAGEPGTGGVERGDQQLGHEQAATDAEDRRHEAEHERLDRDHPADLAARRADGTQQRQLAQALTDRDVEHVVDDEGTDECGDEGEDEQAVAEHRDELADRIARLLGELLAGDHFETVRHDRFDLALHGGDVGPVVQGDVDGVDEPVGAEHLQSPSRGRPPRSRRRRSCRTSPCRPFR